MQTHGFVHSYETFGTKDGPGIRFIYFLQGCHLRCLYCHNADTWNKGEKTKMSVDEAFHEIEKVKGFIKSGGVTVSGGEPLMQAKFVLELFKKCKENGIHTCVDTNGYLFNDDIKEVLEITDLVLLDIKHIDPEKYLKLTEVELEPTLQFMQYLSEINKPTWLRYVLVPGYTDDAEDLE
nr:pyruvate formate lyase-activating protein [Cloacibacterium sp.]